MTECPPHHWQLPEQNGPTATGRCKKCGAEKEFGTSEEMVLGSWKVRNRQKVTR